MAIDLEQKSDYLNYLPAIFSKHPFVGRFLLAFEQVLTGLEGSDSEPQQGLEEIISDILKLFDASETKENFLDWLASWAALSLRADWTPAQQREFLAQIVPLYRFRGTKDNLIELLKIYTGLEPRIIEAQETVFQIGVHSTIGVDTQLGGGTPHFFRIIATLPNPGPDILVRQRQIITALVDQQKPAHTDYELEIIFQTIQIGVRSTIGVDTLLGSIPE